MKADYSQFSTICYAARLYGQPNTYVQVSDNGDLVVSSGFQRLRIPRNLVQLTARRMIQALEDSSAKAGRKQK